MISNDSNKNNSDVTLICHVDTICGYDTWLLRR